MALSITLWSMLFLWQKRDIRTPEIPRQVSIGEVLYSLEVADSEEERATGLGGRDSLCERCAMLFVFDQSGKHGFWMKEMRFPLDIVWLRDGTIVHIKQYVLPEDREVYRPSVEANQVLEFNAGAADSLRVGESVRFLFPGK